MSNGKVMTQLDHLIGCPAFEAQQCLEKRARAVKSAMHDASRAGRWDDFHQLAAVHGMLQGMAGQAENLVAENRLREQYAAREAQSAREGRQMAGGQAKGGQVRLSVPFYSMPAVAQ